MLHSKLGPPNCAMLFQQLAITSLRFLLSASLMVLLRDSCSDAVCLGIHKQVCHGAHGQLQVPCLLPSFVKAINCLGMSDSLKKSKRCFHCFESGQWASNCCCPKRCRKCWHWGHSGAYCKYRALGPSPTQESSLPSLRHYAFRIPLQLSWAILQT